MGPTKVSKADFDKTLAKNSADTSAKQNAESIELLRQAAGKLEDASVDDIAAVLSNLSLADREKLENVLRSNAVKVIGSQFFADGDEETKPVDGPKSLEDARGDVEAQPPQGTDKVKDPCGGAICGCF